MTKQRPRIFRDGAIAASVWERTGSRGRYHELTLSRSFRQKDAETFGYSACFRERDAEALKRCIDQAAEWMRAQPSSDAQPERATKDPDGDGPQGDARNETGEVVACGE